MATWFRPVPRCPLKAKRLELAQLFPELLELRHWQALHVSHKLLWSEDMEYLAWNSSENVGRDLLRTSPPGAVMKLVAT